MLGRILLFLPQNNLLTRCTEVGLGEQSTGADAEKRRQKSRFRSTGVRVVLSYVEKECGRGGGGGGSP